MSLAGREEPPEVELSDERTEPPSCFGSREHISRAEVGAITRRLHAQGRGFYGYKLIDRQAVLSFRQGGQLGSSVALPKRRRHGVNALLQSLEATFLQDMFRVRGGLHAGYLSARTRC